MQGGQTSVVVFNPLAERVTEVISVFVETSDVCVVEASTGKEIFYQVRTVQIFYRTFVGNDTLHRQINPTWNVSGFFRLDITFVEISFLAILEPLSVSRFEVIKDGFAS